MVLLEVLQFYIYLHVDSLVDAPGRQCSSKMVRQNAQVNGCSRKECSSKLLIFGDGNLRKNGNSILRKHFWYNILGK